ncbi:ComF family protein [Legionella micdadei]|uniref:ComF family protein n=1 Tax=Legionella micdadei TaxID=451 RepID=A0A098GID9_LEGMI|nr:ComF family protein [Legionella micdadei]KTD26532.1 competence protein ComF [Legionella micdadei]NSL17878.1 ComF family protein [Legionella micdadei]CEG61750.1 Competence protein ComF [Legionella micdadei]SCY22365.1 comF family protein [Legionella micdadei]
MRQKITSITQLLRLPSVCVLCNQYHDQPFPVCHPCTRLFKKIGPACRYCAHPLPDEKYLVCGICVKEKPTIDNTITAYRFEEPLRTLLHGFKYHEAFYLGGFLAKLILEALANRPITTECLIPVPLHPKRLRQRGFNQAVELSRILSKKLQIPCEPNLCKRIVHTDPQVNLDRKQRKQNVRGAFQSKLTHYQHITLVDDLLTTGSTANELARVLKQQGATRIDLWCCARAF